MVKEKLLKGWKEKECRYRKGSQQIKARIKMIPFILLENTAIPSPPKMKGLKIRDFCVTSVFKDQLNSPS